MQVLDDVKRYLRRFTPAYTVPAPIQERRQARRVPRVKGITPDKAYKHRLSPVWMTTEGTVSAILPDDTIGTPHQRFVISTAQGLKVQVVHNLSLASRVPLALGDRLIVCGEYMWTRKGGAIHWTHDCPDGVCDSGYIYHPRTATKYE